MRKKNKETTTNRNELPLMDVLASLFPRSTFASCNLSKRARSIETIKGGTNSESFDSFVCHLKGILSMVDVPGFAESGPTLMVSLTSAASACFSTWYGESGSPENTQS